MTTPAGGNGAPGYFAWRHRLALLVVASTLLLVYAGGLVTSTGSGLAVPDWPLSYGMLFPPMIGGIFYEHGHRMVATGVGFLTLVLAVWTGLEEPRRGLRLLAWSALALVVVQGVLGGLTVLLLLPASVSVAHACLAQTFLCVTIALAFVASREWLSGPGAAEDRDSVRPAAATAVAAVYFQLGVGAVMRHSHAGLAIPDFPLAFGGLAPPLVDARVAVHFAHRVLGVVVLVAIAWLVGRCARSGDRRLLRPALAALALTLIQIALGGISVLTAKATTPTTLHVANGAAILGLVLLVALRAFRHLRRAPAASGSPAPARPRSEGAAA